MKREILFRGKRVDNGEWVKGCYMETHYNNHSNYFKNGDVSHKIYPMLHDVNPHEVIPETVGQFTGLTDKNGMKIFEGDVLTSHHYPFQDEGERNYDAIIEWIESGWQYVLTCVNSEKRGISEGINSWLGDDGSQVEVIGNIHDNV